MEHFSSWVTVIVGVGSLLGSIATAIATIFLWRVTKVLARETTRMAEASAQPHIVATIIPNRWSMMHVDLHVQNTGNATAYDIKICFDPPLKNGSSRGEEIPIPLQCISVLKPGQVLSSYLSEYALLKGVRFAVDVSWRKKATDEECENNRYAFNMDDYDGISRLGEEPIVQIAKHIKKIDENWAPVTRGAKRIKVDTFDRSDRIESQRELERQRGIYSRAPTVEDGSASPQASSTDSVDEISQ